MLLDEHVQFRTPRSLALHKSFRATGKMTPLVSNVKEFACISGKRISHQPKIKHSISF